MKSNWRNTIFFIAIAFKHVHPWPRGGYRGGGGRTFAPPWDFAAKNVQNLKNRMCTPFFKLFDYLLVKFVIFFQKKINISFAYWVFDSIFGIFCSYFHYWFTYCTLPKHIPQKMFVVRVEQYSHLADDL